MSTWNTTSTNSRFGSTVVGPAIEGSSSTAWRSKQSLSIPFRTSPWSNVPREQRVRPQPVGAKTGNLSEVNNHLAEFRAQLTQSSLDELAVKQAVEAAEKELGIGARLAELLDEAGVTLMRQGRYDSA